MTFGTAVYYMIVTMSTVGYGDVTPKTSRGRAVVSCIIITAWILVPIQISKLYEARPPSTALPTLPYVTVPDAVFARLPCAGAGPSVGLPHHRQPKEVSDSK